MQSTLKLYDGNNITFNHPDRFHLPRFLAEYGLKNYEPVSQASFLAAAEMLNGCVYDIGSNIGIYSLGVTSALRLPVYAYEPFEEAASVLRNIANDYGYPIYVTNCAIGESEGVQEFYISMKSDMSNSLNPDFRSHREVRKVQIKTIDSVSKNIRPSAIKIDVETTELQVLLGAAATIRRDKPVILMEVLNQELEVKVNDFFDDFGYKIIKMGDLKYHGMLGNVANLNKDGDERNWLMIPPGFDDGVNFVERVRNYVDLIEAASK